MCSEHVCPNNYLIRVESIDIEFNWLNNPTDLGQKMKEKEEKEKILSNWP